MTLLTDGEFLHGGVDDEVSYLVYLAWTSAC